MRLIEAPALVGAVPHMFFLRKLVRCSSERDDEEVLNIRMYRCELDWNYRRVGAK